MKKKLAESLSDQDEKRTKIPAFIVVAVKATIEFLFLQLLQKESAGDE